MSVSTQLRFSDNKSFRLFTEGLRALQSYERTAKREELIKAEGRFEECVANYQQDVLPRLYLGIVKTHEGESLTEAIELLQGVLDRKLPELTATAKYYLAEAHVAKYKTEDFKRAYRLLEEVIADPDTSLSDYLRAEALRTFIYVRERVWNNREEKETPEHQDAEAEALKRLEEFRANVDGSAVSDVSEDLKTSLQADYWNSAGLLKEYQAHKTTQYERAALVQASLDAFDKASQYGANRADALSNKARVYFDLADKSDLAAQLGKEVLALREGDSFAHLLLGRVFKKNGQFEKALEHFQATAKFHGEGAFEAGQCYEKMDDPDSAVDMYGQVPSTDKRYEHAELRLGRIYIKKGLFEQALQHFSNAMAKFIGEGAFEAGRCYEQMKDFGYAVQMYDQVPSTHEHYEDAQNRIKLLENKT